ncbi:MAG: hypothetical protein KAJ14_01780, partial [Candidatus Omnitrophica bacterium]|nr:hypothetical protein [Candidatus Omnitrophota bacterium]
QEGDSRSVTLTEAGYDYVAIMLFGASEDNPTIPVRELVDYPELLGMADNALKAHHVYVKDSDTDEEIEVVAGTQRYRVNKSEVLTVAAGRTQEGRRFKDGIHEALEAKEHNEEVLAKKKPVVEVQNPSMSVASISLQSFYDNYQILSGLTGTAQGIQQELKDTYALDTLIIPTNKPNIRKDLPDLIFKTNAQRNKAVASEVLKEHQNGMPILIGAAGVNESADLAQMIQQEFSQSSNAVVVDSEQGLIELASKILKRSVNQGNLQEALVEIKKKGDFGQQIPVFVLNDTTKRLEKEIVFLAGLKGAITVATDMAGRGTDIKLVEIARMIDGLNIMGTEYPESERTEYQFRGRSGRQGQPGKTRYYIDLESDLFSGMGSGVAEKLANQISDNGTEIIGSIKSKITILRGKRTGNSYKQREELNKDDETLSKFRNYIYEIVDALIDENTDIELSEILSLIFGDQLDSEVLKAQLEAISNKVTETELREKIVELVTTNWTNFINSLEDLARNRNVLGLGLKKDENTLRAIFKKQSAEIFEEMLEDVRQNVRGALILPLMTENDMDVLGAEAGQRFSEEQPKSSIFDVLNPLAIAQRIKNKLDIKTEKTTPGLMERFSKWLFGQERGTSHRLRSFFGTGFYAFTTVFGIFSGLFTAGESGAADLSANSPAMLMQYTRDGFSWENNSRNQIVSQLSNEKFGKLIAAKMESAEFLARHKGVAEAELMKLAQLEVLKEISFKAARGENILSVIEAPVEEKAVVQKEAL